VGIDDDPFLVASHLKGPKGTYIAYILAEVKGANIWVVGEGTNSRFDNEGPLSICVGAVSAPAFNTAVGLVQDLLAKTRDDYPRSLQLR